MWAGEHWGGVLNENEYRRDHSDGVQCGGESDLRRVCGSMVYMIQMFGTATTTSPLYVKLSFAVTSPVKVSSARFTFLSYHARRPGDGGGYNASYSGGLSNCFKPWT